MPAYSLLFQTDFSPVQYSTGMTWDVMHWLTGAFMAVLFLQSGLDKAFHYKGNVDYFKDHFKNTLLASSVGLMTAVITLLEITAGLFCLLGLFGSLFPFFPFAFFGMALAGLDLLCLFLGQRLAKDYVGAANLVPYFILAIIGLYLTARY